MTGQDPSLGIAFPVYNEEAVLEASVEKTLRFCEEEGLPGVRITIADNGSVDATAKLARKLAERHKSVDFVSVGEKGVGRALKAAWSASRCDYVGYMDLDLATKLEHLHDVTRLIREGTADVITGSRWIPGAIVTGRPWIRGLTSWGFNALLKFALDVRFTDGMCGFKFLRRRSYEALAARYRFTDEWFFNAEILIKAQWEGLHISEVPVHWVDRPDSKVRLLETITQYLGDIRRVHGERGAA